MTSWGNPTAPKFYPGAKEDSPWNQDLNWKDRVRKEMKDNQAKEETVFMRKDPSKLNTSGALINPGSPVFVPVRVKNRLPTSPIGNGGPSKFGESKKEGKRSGEKGSVFSRASGRSLKSVRSQYLKKNGNKPKAPMGAVGENSTVATSIVTRRELDEIKSEMQKESLARKATEKALKTLTEEIRALKSMRED